MISEQRLGRIINEKMDEIKKLSDFQRLNLQSHEKFGTKLGEETLRDMISFYAKEFALKELVDIYISSFGEGNAVIDELKKVIYKRVKVYEGQLLNMIRGKK